MKVAVATFILAYFSEIINDCKSQLPHFIFVRGIFNTLSIQIGNHAVKFALPHFLEPLGVTEPLYEGRADCIISTDKRSAIPCFSQSIVTETAQSPYLGTIIRTVNSSCDIATTHVGFWSLIRRIVFRNLFVIAFDDISIHLFI